MNHPRRPPRFHLQRRFARRSAATGGSYADLPREARMTSRPRRTRTIACHNDITIEDFSPSRPGSVSSSRILRCPRAPSIGANVDERPERHPAAHVRATDAGPLFTSFPSSGPASLSRVRLSSRAANASTPISGIARLPASILRPLSDTARHTQPTCVCKTPASTYSHRSRTASRIARLHRAALRTSCFCFPHTSSSWREGGQSRASSSSNIMLFRVVVSAVVTALVAARTASAKQVFAHLMFGEQQQYTVQDYIDDQILARQVGIDAL